MTYDFQIKGMSIYDIPEVLILERDAFGKMAWSSGDFESAINSSYDHPFVIHDDSSVAGYSVLRILAPEAEVEDICVSSAMRKQGMGERLLRHMIDVARENGAENIYLEVRSKNEAAICLYRKMGFQDSYVRKGYYRDPVDDAVIMVLKL
ncbi:ribosomal protein S18-alanine N-acetyltransferase [Oribacterium sp. C9]|uniref:ribosomal protein S18-alanine N-acetyltransferase n=1 Tax=Oribacterium sp. C9 TaxID=1943579 RepID=UPI00098F1CA2|nr:ribosomal protein S18-alanine N-acetyltransferase [Oribacterium sp. C9]